MNRNTFISVVLCLVVPTFVAGAVLFTPLGESWVAPFVVACLLCPLAAAFFGHAAKRELRRDGIGKSWSARMASTGLTIGYLELALVVLVTLGSGHRPSRIVASEAVTVGSLRSINFAAHAYAKAHPQLGFPTSLLDLTSNGPQGKQDWWIDASLASGTKFGYRFTYAPRPAKHNGVVDGYQVLADPADAEDQNRRHFFTDESEVIRASRGTSANESSAALN